MYDDDDEFADDEEWSDEDDESAEVVACPNCRAEVYEEAEQCPKCGEYIVHDTSELSGKPLWYVILALAGIVAVVVVLSGLAALL